MANTLTDLIPTMYAALNVVSREQIGFIPAVARNSSAERAALNQNITIPLPSVGEPADNTPGVTPPDSGDNSLGNVTMTISKSKHVAIRWNGEQTLGMQNAGTFGTTLQGQFEEAFRKLSNMIEADLAGLYVHASRAYGAAGTAPFGTAGDLSDFAGVRQILDDNGAPKSDLHLVLGSAAMASIRGKQSGLFKVNEAGTDQLLRTGTLGQVEGLAVHDSAQVAAHTKGTANASYDTNLVSTLAVGAEDIAVDTGAGTLVAGDVVTFTGDSNKYVVGTALSGGTLSINPPGLRQTLADGVDLALGNSYRANLAFHRNAIQLITRAPAQPQGGDSAVDVMQVTDPVSGLTFEVAHYKLFQQAVYHVRIAWGVACIKPAHMAILLG